MKKSDKTLVITNTQDRPEWPTLPGYPSGLLDGGRGILQQEARGTREVAAANGTRLPRDGTTRFEDADRCKAVGIILGKPVEGDDLFREAQLPKEWTTTYSPEDSRTTLILDAKGSRRGHIWYKAASYDRSAYLCIYNRYWVQEIYPDRSDYSMSRCVVRDRVTSNNLWESPALVSPAKRSGATPVDWKAYEAERQARFAEATAWLDQNFPEWKNPAAYWP